MRFSLFSTTVICLIISASATTAADQPNIIMILSDDQGWTDYGFMGHEAIQTPHLDRLASRSAVFRRGYTPVPLCRPSLMSIITGLYPHQHGVTGNDPAPDVTLTDADYGLLKERLIAANRWREPPASSADPRAAAQAASGSATSTAPDTAGSAAK